VDQVKHLHSPKKRGSLLGEWDDFDLNFPLCNSMQKNDCLKKELIEKEMNRGVRSCKQSKASLSGGGESLFHTRRSLFIHTGLFSCM